MTTVHMINSSICGIYLTNFGPPSKHYPERTRTSLIHDVFYKTWVDPHNLNLLHSNNIEEIIRRKVSSI